MLPRPGDEARRLPPAHGVDEPDPARAREVFDADYEFERETVLESGTIELHRDRLQDPVWRLGRAQLFAKFQYLFRL